MHDSVQAWIKEQVDLLDLSTAATLEIGSADVNGSVRSYFSGEYVGVDLNEAPGVDQIVESGEPLPFQDHTFDVVVTTEMLEHDPRPWVTFGEIARVLRPAGVLLLTCRGYNRNGCFPVHNEPDIWRFSQDALVLLAGDVGMWMIDVRPDPQVPGWFMSAMNGASNG